MLYICVCVCVCVCVHRRNVGKMFPKSDSDSAGSEYT